MGKEWEGRNGNRRMGAAIRNPMIYHIVLFRLKSGTAQETIDAAGRALLSMKQRIPDIRDVQWGANLGPSAAEYSHILLVSCDDMVAVQRYLDHPMHKQTVAEFIHPIRDARMAADLEIN